MRPVDHRIQITYRMFTPIEANGKFLTLNFPIDSGVTKSRPNNLIMRHIFQRMISRIEGSRNILLVIALLVATWQPYANKQNKIK